MNNKDLPAHPIFNEHGFVTGSASGGLSGEGAGLTKLEAFTMAAMQGLLSNPRSQFDFDERGFSEMRIGGISVKAIAIEMAQATIEALEKVK